METILQRNGFHSFESQKPPPGWKSQHGVKTMTDETKQHTQTCPIWSNPRTDGTTRPNSSWLQRQHLGGQATFLRIQMGVLKDFLAVSGTISGQQLADASAWGDYPKGGYWNFLDSHGKKGARLPLEDRVGLRLCSVARKTLAGLLAPLPSSLGICICFDEWQVCFTCLDHLPGEVGFMLGEPTA